jgi:hypothetical protein
MADKRCEIEVTLEDLVIHSAAKLKDQTRHLLGATLLWPRVGTLRKTYSISVGLGSGLWRAAGRPWSQRILLKETVRGRVGFELTLTAALSDEDADAFLRSLASQLVKFTAGQAEDLLAPPLLGSLAELPLNYLVKVLLKEKAPAMLGRGGLDLETGQLPAVGGRVRWELPLTAPEAIVRTVRRRVGKTQQRRREVLVPAGAEVGRCLVEAVVL